MTTMSLSFPVLFATSSGNYSYKALRQTQFEVERQTANTAGSQKQTRGCARSARRSGKTLGRHRWRARREPAVSAGISSGMKAGDGETVKNVPVQKK